MTESKIIMKRYKKFCEGPLHDGPFSHKVGDVVFWPEVNNLERHIEWGIVSEIFSPEEICIDKYILKDNRIINGVPIGDMKFPTEWEKLPKGWRWDTPLLTVDYVERQGFNIAFTAENIKKQIELGNFVPSWRHSKPDINSEVDKNKGFRIVANYNNYVSPYSTLRVWEVFDSPEEAKEVIDEYEAELKRVSELSDYDWSVEEIDKVITRWKRQRHINDSAAEKVRDWILDHDNIEDLVVRYAGGKLEWKYDKNKKWSRVPMLP